MSSLRALARLMKELEDQLVVCMRCGLCQAVCPLFAETGREADVARGKLALLDGLPQEILKNPQGVQDHLTRCLLCGSCAANCPSGVKVLDIFIKARAILAGYLGLSPVKKAIFRGLLAKPDLQPHHGLGRQIPGHFHQAGGRPPGLLLRPVHVAAVVRPAPQTPGADPLAPQVPGATPPPAPPASRWPFSWAASSTRSIPRWRTRCSRPGAPRGGAPVPAGQGCCGIPALSGGDTETFRHLVRHNLELLDVPRRPSIIWSPPAPPAPPPSKSSGP